MKMITTIVHKLKLSAFFAAMALFFSILPAQVSFGSETSHTFKWIHDEADLYSVQEEQEINGQLQKIRDEKGIDTVIVTVSGTDGKSARDFADDYLGEGGYGYGSENNAILLLIDMGGREFYISTMGADTLKCFNDARIDKMLDNIAKDIVSENYLECADSFMDDVSQYMGTDPAVKERGPVTGMDIAVRLLISLAVGAAVSLATWCILRRGTPVAVHAGDYLVEDSIKITGSEDTFINCVTTTRHIPKESSGGTSTHTSRSGQTHGGGGRSF